MKCYRCNNILDEDDIVCSKCGSKVVKLQNKKPKYKTNTKEEFYNFAVSLLVTKFFSLILAFFSLLNLVFPWLLLSITFALIGLFKFKDKRNIKIIVIDTIIIITEIVLLIIFYKKIFSLF